MAAKDPRIDAYAAAAAPFARPILKHLRKIVHAGCSGVQETTKWSMPHFDYKGMFCGMAAFNQHCTFGFWKGSLLFDTDTVADEKAMGQFGRITALSDLPPDKVLIDYVRKAAALNDAGVKSPPRAKPLQKKAPLKMPSDFVFALKKNAFASRTFEKFSASQRREYVEWVTEAKREATRAKRLATAIEWMAEGKPYHWRYLPKKR